MTTEEIEVVKDLIGNIDYYLGAGDLPKVNQELNTICKYILQKEGYKEILDEVPLDTDILSGYVPKAKVRFTNYQVPFVIPNTKYEFYKKQYVNSK